MPYPATVRVVLNSINGNSCGSLEHQLTYMDGSNPPEYEMEDSGDFDWVMLLLVGSGGSTSWQLFLDVATNGPCDGNHVMRRSPAADDPTGTFCVYSGGSINCSLGQATVTEV